MRAATTPTRRGHPRPTGPILPILPPPPLPHKWASHAARAAGFLDVNLAREPSEVPTLQLLLKANGLPEAHAKELPVVFVNGRLLAGGGGPPLQQLEDEGALSSALRAAQSPPLQVAERKGESLPTLRQVPRRARRPRGAYIACPVAKALCQPRVVARVPCLTPPLPPPLPWQVLAGDGAQAPLRQGWLLKEGAVFKRWQRRYCVLVHGSIYYFRGKDAAAAAQGTIPLAGSTCRVLNSDFHFEIVTPRRVFLLRVDRADERGVLSSMSALFGGGGDGLSAVLSQRSREPSVQASQRSREPSMQCGASVSAAAAAAAAAGGGESDANAASRSGKDLAAWMAALQRAHALRPEEVRRRPVGLSRVHASTPAPGVKRVGHARPNPERTPVQCRRGDTTSSACIISPPRTARACCARWGRSSASTVS